MKRFLSALLALLLCLSLLGLIACGNETPEETDTKETVEQTNESEKPTESETASREEDSTTHSFETDPVVDTESTEANEDSTAGETESLAGSESEHKHTVEIIPAVEPTCTADGMTQGQKCADCGEILVAQRLVSKVAHTWGVDGKCTACGEKKSTPAPDPDEVVTPSRPNRPSHKHTVAVIPAVPATCTEEGRTEGQICTECGTVIVSQRVLEAKGHTEVTDNAVAPTCRDTGLSAGKHCAVCNEILEVQTVVPALPHTETEDEAVPATCTTAGLSTGKHCTVCGKVTLEQTVVKPLEHDWDEGVPSKDPDCTEKGETVYTCETCGATKTAVIPAAGHDYVDAVTAPTCIKKGYTTHTCSVCNVSYTDSEVPALEHDWNGVELTCLTGRTCVREGCGGSEPPMGHDYRLNKKQSAEASCTTPAIHAYYCTHCGDEYTNEVAPALGHDIAAVEPTEEQIGKSCEYIRIYICKTCEKPVEGTHVFHHTYSAKVTTDATCRTTGTKTHTCTACGDHYDEAIPTTEAGHVWVEGVKEGDIIPYTCSICSETKTVVDASEKTEASVSSGDLQSAGEVKLLEASIGLDADTLTQVNGKDLTLGAGILDSGKRADVVNTLTPEQQEQLGDRPIYSFTMEEGTTPITTFDGYVTITIPYDLKDGEDVDSIAVWFVNADGQLESFPAVYNNGSISFKTNHFSYYTVTRLTPAERCALYKHIDTVKVVSPTCTEGGYTLTICTRCGRTEKGELTKALGHAYGEEVTAATCDNAGQKIYTCQNENCNHSYTETLPATGHKWSLTEEETATCMGAGYRIYTCGNCNTSYKEVEAQLTHSFAEAVTLPTCTTDGYTTHTCESCSYSYTDALVEALGHDYAVAWLFDSETAPTSVKATLTCTHDETHTVTVDGTLSGREVPGSCPATTGTLWTAAASYNGESFVGSLKTGAVGGHEFATALTADKDTHYNLCPCGEKANEEAHSFTREFVVTAATCLESGAKQMLCECGESVNATIPALGHNFVNGVCSRCRINEKDCDHEERTLMVIDLEAEGACTRTMLVLEICQCGEVCRYVGARIGCLMEQVNAELGLDRSKTEYACTRCDYSYSVEDKIVKDSATCKQTTESSYTFFLNGEVIRTATATEETYWHDSEDLEIDLAQYGGCGAKLTYKKCRNCGEEYRLQVVSDGCELYSYVIEDTVGGDGYAIDVYACDTCGLKVFCDMVFAPVEEGSCIQDIFCDATVTVNDEEVLAMTTTYGWLDLHEYDYQYQLLGESCTDGLVGVGACVTCGLNGTFYGDDSHAGSVYEEQTFGTEGCCSLTVEVGRCTVCGELSYVNVWPDGAISSQFGGTYEQDGLLYEDWYFSCDACDFCYAETYIYAPAGNGGCLYNYSLQYVIAKGDELLGSFLGGPMGRAEIHDNETTYELYGKSCEEGYLIIETCKRCGESTTYENSSHISVKSERVEYDPAGTCGIVVSVQQCEYCGMQNGIWLEEINCGFQVSAENGKDENGNSYTVWTQICSECGLVFIEREVETGNSENPCWVSLHTYFEIYYNGELLGAYESTDRARSNHDTETSYELKGESCEEGYTIIETCKRCGWSSQREGSGHRIDNKQNLVVLGPEGSCGGVVVNALVCSICGDTSNTQLESTICKFEWTEEEGTAADGTPYILQTATCPNCAFHYTAYMVETPSDEPCVTWYDVTYSFYYDGELLLSYDSQEGYGKHDYRFSYEMKGESCEDGYTVIATCKACGSSYTVAGKGHRYDDGEQTIELKPEGACGMTVSFMQCSLCGETSNGWIERSKCKFLAEREDSTDPDGTVHTIWTNECDRCGMSYIERETRIPTSDPCWLDFSSVTTIFYNGEELFSFTSNGRTSNHDMESRVTLLPGADTCKDGVSVIRICRVCKGNDYEEIFYDHYTTAIETIDLGEMGSVCGGSYVRYACLCGQEDYWSKGDDCACDFDRRTVENWLADTYEGKFFAAGAWKEINASAYTMTCGVSEPEACGFVIRVQDYWVKEGCLAYGHERWQFGYNADTDTAAREIDISTGRVVYAHDYTVALVNTTEGELTVSGEEGVCADCESYYRNLNYLDADGTHVKSLHEAENKGAYATAETSEYAYRYVKLVYEYERLEGDFIVSKSEAEVRIAPDGSEYSRTVQYSYDGCTRTATVTEQDGTVRTETQEHFIVTRETVKEGSCSQERHYQFYCAICEAPVDERIVEAPADHKWYADKENGGFYCKICGLESAVGSSGSIIMEDFTEKYGNGTDYVIGYAALNEVQFSYYVSLILHTPAADGNDEVVLQSIAFTTRDDEIRAISFKKADVLAAAEAAGLAAGEYDVRFSFVPVGADGSLDYAITLTDEAVAK